MMSALLWFLAGFGIGVFFCVAGVIYGIVRAFMSMLDEAQTPVVKVIVKKRTENQKKEWLA